MSRATGNRRFASDPALIQACIAGDRSAWDELIEHYGRLVYSIPMRYGMDRNEADEVFQSVFAILLERLEQLRDQTRVSSWLITTAHRECWRRGRRKPVDAELDEREIAADAPPEASVQQWELQNAVRAGLDRLGDPCKSLLHALFLSPAERDYKAIADELGMRVGSIGPTRARCFEKLERILGEMGVSG